MAFALPMDNPQPRLKPLVVHPLPVAPIFLGRESELERIGASLDRGGVLSLVGVGGSGKTATVERFLRSPDVAKKFDAVIVWSFYDDPDTNAFLRTAVEYLTGGSSQVGHGSGWFQLLKQAIEARPSTLLVLDGLERIQRPVTSPTGIYGELEDPLLKALLARIANVPEGAKAIVTSRFPLPDLDRLASGYEVINVNELSVDAAQHLLSVHGVEGSSQETAHLLERFGRHALTVDLLGAAICRFFDGKAAAVPVESAKETDTSQALRLSEVLKFFEKGLGAREHDLMSRLCVFRFGVTAETLAGTFARAEQSVAGALAGANVEDLEELAMRLTDAHLLYKEGDQYSVHPAVRDHFYALFRDSAVVHGAITKHLLSLSARPGVGLPTSKDSLDLLEELVFHSLRAGRPLEAVEIYQYRMGGSDHLNTTLGEYSRTFRILQAFPECPDPGGMYHCMRASGAFDEALKWRPQNRYILLAKGKLLELASEQAEATSVTARFLMGERVAPPDRTPDFPITAASLMAMQGRLDDAYQKCDQELRLSMYADDLARVRINRADVLQRQGRMRDAAKELQAISPWVLSSGSQEHLCLYYHATGRYELANGKLPAADSALSESLQLGREAGFNLFVTDILVSVAELYAQTAREEKAIDVLIEAIALSKKPEMRYAWGEAAALSELANIYRATGRPVEARASLVELLEVQRRIGHYEAASTQKTLASLR
jgi:tetratricopeptide (TPR) repeat protein